MKKLIETLLSDSKLASIQRSDVYRDEPIIQTASQLDNYTPPKYREMRQLAKTRESFTQSSEEIFYHQGKFMEDFEDDFNFRGNFFNKRPTYNTMDISQLRGYFSWRTKLRHGDIQEAPTGFVFIYIYELLNLIGVSSAIEGFDKLLDFKEKYNRFDISISCYIDEWLNDMVIFYGLDKALLDGITDFTFDDSVSLLMHYTEYSRDEVFSALQALSSYSLTASRFFKDHPEDVKAAVCGTYSRLFEHYECQLKQGVCEKLFGMVYTYPHPIFSGAVFFDRFKYSSREYVINEVNKYVCSNGKWEHRQFIGYRDKNQQIGLILKAVDAIMREKYHYGHPLKLGKTPKVILDAINKEADYLFEEKRKKEAAERAAARELEKAKRLEAVKIDVSRLDEIRISADETRNKLITEEDILPDEPEAAVTSVTSEVIPEAPCAPPLTQPENSILSDAELSFLRDMLSGLGAHGQGGITTSLLIDSINEKFYDTFGDTVIIYNGDTPELLEDYTEELKGMMGI